MVLQIQLAVQPSPISEQIGLPAYEWSMHILYLPLMLIHRHHSSHGEMYILRTNFPHRNFNQMKLYVFFGKMLRKCYSYC